MLHALRCGMHDMVGVRMDTASERVRQRMKEWVEQQGHGSQRRLANSVLGPMGEPKSDQWVSDIINRRADLTLRDLDSVAETIGVPPGWLVRKHDRNYEELTMAETKVVSFFRQLPDTIRHAWLLIVDYFVSTKVLKRGKGLSQSSVAGVQIGTPPAASSVGAPSHVSSSVSREDFRQNITQLITDTVASLERLQSLSESDVLTPDATSSGGASLRPTAARGRHATSARWRQRKT
jgi:hypothetical protein